jgi:hypothetical protein
MHPFRCTDGSPCLRLSPRLVSPNCRSHTPQGPGHSLPLGRSPFDPRTVAFSGSNRSASLAPTGIIVRTRVRSKPPNCNIRKNSLAREANQIAASSSKSGPLFARAESGRSLSAEPPATFVQILLRLGGPSQRSRLVYHVSCRFRCQTLTLSLKDHSRWQRY